MTNASPPSRSDTSPSSTLADLRLEDVVVEALHVRTDAEAPNFDNESRAMPIPEITVDILRAGDEPRFMIPMTIRINRAKDESARFGYALDMTILGFFSFESGTQEHHVGHLISLNAPAMLYGVARGIIAQTLAWTFVGRVFLPSINFVEIMRMRDERVRRRQRRSARSST